MALSIYEIPSVQSGKRLVKGGFKDAEDAYEYVSHNVGKIIYCEEDKDNPGYLDLYAEPGRVLSIEPMKESA
jgi:hypothetical protein